MLERRRHKRFTVDVMEIQGRMMFANEVEILDISLGGVSVKVDRRVNIGNEYKLKIECKNKILPVKAVVVWASLSETKKDALGNIIPIYTAGMRFTEVTADKLREIADFIEAHTRDEDRQIDIFEKSGRRLYARVRVIVPSKATLDFQETYRIKEISLGGALIESEHTMEINNRLQMEISLTDDAPIALLGRVASCRILNEQEPVLYGIGI
jgi:Tfp pilus assembly protein PilZ